MKDYFFNWKQSTFNGLAVLEVVPCSWDGDCGFSRLYVPELHLWFNSWSDLELYLSFEGGADS